MSHLLSLPLVAEAIILDVSWNFDILAFRKMRDSPLLDRLDLILQTVITFSDAFSEMFVEIFEIYCHEGLSEEEFLAFVIPRCLILCKKKNYFNFILTCSFMSEIVYYFITSFNCFHFAKLTWICLLQIAKYQFEDLLGTEHGWEGLLCFCEKVKEKVISQSVEKNVYISDNMIVKIEMDTSYTLNEESLIKHPSSMNIDSEINLIKACRLQVNSKDSLVNPGGSTEDKMAEQNIPQNIDIPEFEGISQKLSHSSSFKEIESTSENGCDMTNKIEFLYELVTESPEHLNEIIILIDDCAENIDPDSFPLIEYDGLCSDKEMISAILSQEMCSPQCDTSISRYGDSKSTRILDDTLYEKKLASKEEIGDHSIPSSISTSAEDGSECPSDSSIGTHAESPSLSVSDTSLSLATLDNDHTTSPWLNSLENETNPVQCCELCKGKEYQYLKYWGKEFLKKYPELHQTKSKYLENQARSVEN